MIILDEEEEQLAKLATPLPIHSRTNRPSTPSPSLPDYETSQVQQEQVRSKRWRTPLSRRWKWTLWGLAAYFVVTVAIGVPLIVVVRYTSFLQHSSCAHVRTENKREQRLVQESKYAVSDPLQG